MLATRLTRQHLASPFPGLRSFSQDESELFFGREGQSDEIARKLGQTRFIAVVGTSGSGKSSLVRAGLLPSLESGCLVKSGSSWRIVDMRPGSRPIVHLAAALDGAKVSESPVDAKLLRNSSLALIDLARSAYGAKHLDNDENLLILVDQFEELFRYKTRDMADRDEKAAFVKLLLEVAKQRDFPVYVVITLRSDFLGDCARFRDLPETINAGQYLVPRMTRDQRREAIEGPIHMAGNTIAPRLIQRILNDVGEDPDQLPVMQHALMRTWCRWSAQAHRDNAIDIPDYEAVGALENALSSHADEAYAEACARVPERGRQIVKHMFQCLRERDASGRETRRPTALSELCAVAEASPEEALAILECFREGTRSFLMPPMSVNLGADREVDITHESLLRQWKRLLGPASEDDGWLAEEEESRRIILRLADRVEQQSQGSKDYLRGPLLQLALDWWNKRKPNAAWAKRYTQSFEAADEFLRESQENRKREVEQEIENREKEEQARVEQVRREEELKAKQLKVFGAYIFGALALIISIGGAVGFSMVQRQKGVVQRQEVRLQQQTLQRIAEQAAYEKTKSEERATEAEKDKLKEAKAREIAEDLEAKLIVQMLTNQAETGITKGGSLLPLSILLATESMRRQPLVDNQFVLSKGLSLLPKLVGQLRNSAIQLTTFSPDGLLVTSEPSFVRVWDPLAQKELKQFHIDGRVGAIAVSNDGQLLGVAYDKDRQGIIQIYKLRTGEPDSQRATEPGVSHLFVGNNGNLTAFNGRLYHWNSWSDQQAGLLTEAQSVLDGGGAVATSSDQRLLALFDRERSTISVHDFSNDARNSWPVDQASVADIAFDPSNGEHLALFDYSGTIKLWSASSQKPYLSLQSGPLTRVDFSWDGQLLAATGFDGTIRVWNTRDGREVASVLPESSVVHEKGTATAVALDGANRMIAVTERGSTRLWQITGIPLPGRIMAAQISLDGRLAALRPSRNQVSAGWRTSGDNILLWNVPDSHLVSTVDPSPIKIVLGVIPGLGLAAGTCDQGFLCVVRFGNDGTATLIRKSKGTIQYPASLIFSNDGRFVAGSYAPKGTGRSGASKRVTNTIVWDIKDQAVEPEIILDGSEPLNASVLGFSPESDRCILRKPPTKDEPGEVKLWDLRKKSFSVVPKPLQRVPVSIAFSADGRLLATSQLFSGGRAGANVISGSSENVAEQSYHISIWHWPDGNESLRTFVADTEVRKMSFSPDNHFLITTGSEPFVRVFDLKTGKENGRVGLPQSSSVPLAMTFVNGDRRIVAFDQDYVTNSLWRSDDLMEEACVRIGRPLTAEEWNKCFPSEKAKYFPTCKAFLPSR